MLVCLFEGWLSDDDPVVVAVDLDAAFGSDQYGSAVKIERERVKTSWRVDGREETYSYQHLGVLSNRYHVLRTYYSGGGTGVFQSLHLVEFASWPAPRSGRARHHVLRLAASVPLGDRDDAQIQVLKDAVRVGASRYRDQPVVIRPASEH